MKMEIIVKNENQEDVEISVLGGFGIEELKKEFIMYSIINKDDNSDQGLVLIGEVVRDGDNVQILGIKEEEKELVSEFYNEIANQLGKEEL